jgi:hypothetical protein
MLTKDSAPHATFTPQPAQKDKLTMTIQLTLVFGLMRLIAVLKVIHQPQPQQPLKDQDQ